MTHGKTMSIETHPGDGGGGDSGGDERLAIGVDQAENADSDDDVVEDPVSELDVDTLRCGTGSYDEVKKHGVTPATHSTEDYDDDAADELLLQFPTDGLDLGDSSGGSRRTIRLVGETHDGHEARGETKLGAA